MPTTSHLWSRRMTMTTSSGHISHSARALSPLLLTARAQTMATAPGDAVISGRSTTAKPTVSSPISCCSSPATRSSPRVSTPPSGAKDVFMDLASDIARRKVAVNLGTEFEHDPRLSFVSFDADKHERQANNPDFDGDQSLLCKLSDMRTDLRCEIDMASLGTEMAMSLFDSDSETSAGSIKLSFDQRAVKRTAPCRLRLLPQFADMVSFDAHKMTDACPLTPATTTTPTLVLRDFGGESASMIDPHAETADLPTPLTPLMETDATGKPIAVTRKRARMSQEKRRRLARRREREALLLSLQHEQQQYQNPFRRPHAHHQAHRYPLLSPLTSHFAATSPVPESRFPRTYAVAPPAGVLKEEMAIQGASKPSPTFSRVSEPVAKSYIRTMPMQSQQSFKRTLPATKEKEDGWYVVYWDD